MVQSHQNPFHKIETDKKLKLQILIARVCAVNIVNRLFSSPEPKAQRLAYSVPMLRCSSLSSSLSSFTIFKHEYLRGKQALRNKILSEASLVWGKGCMGFGADQFRTLVSMATDVSHRVIMGKRRHQVFSNVFDRILFILAGNDDMHES